MMQMSTTRELFLRLLVIALATFLLTAASLEFYNITWGTGEWLGEFSLKWFAAFVLFEAFCVACLEATILAAWHNEKFYSALVRVAKLRNKLGAARWILSAVVLILPIWILQYTAWGLVLHGQYLRWLLWAASAILLGCLLTRSDERALEWLGILSALTLISGAAVFILSLGNVTSYPFSLGWSEGNRWWDYSILFGRDIYIYPEDKPIPVLLDIGRQFIGGIPFLIPNVTIWQARLWVGLVNAVPYFILGLVAFKSAQFKRWQWILVSVWTMIFVLQGPIHPPLLWCAILVAFAWGKPLWLAVPLIFVTSYFAEVSRYTWLFAPGMWAAMLEFSSAESSPSGRGQGEGERSDRTVWVRAISVGAAGILGGYVAPFFIPTIPARLSPNISSSFSGGVTLSGVSAEAGSQELLWYRLFPNATYPEGILLGLLLAVGPLIAVLVYLSVTRRWTLNAWQKLAVILPLLAFLVVGLIVSVKIGGGGDLHNMDMFILGLLFAGAMAWHRSGAKWILESAVSPAWMRLVLLFMVIYPAYYPMKFIAPNRVAEEDMTWVMTLADIPPQGPFPELLPYENDSDKALKDIQNAIKEAALNGDILFIDQRQLLTFKYVTGVPLVPEYDKKVLINEAMSASESYFQTFYRDLAAQRFSLIITNPLHERVQTEEDNFGEENNAWVKWVSAPVLCFYEPLETLKKVRIQLLAPKQDVSACVKYLMP
ncbi:MAG: hypothetical protein HKUEN02_17640 [Anaerolineaceae bacterium]|nr:MAG: hypothetical protein HKUEN02_17640 [Anaerolineaceae bacterium]